MLFAIGLLLAGSAGSVLEDELERSVRAELVRLAETEPGTRRSAVRRLAELGTEEAWVAVLGALDDPEPEVADEAQVRLAGIASDDVVRRLFGRDGLAARDELVRLRVAEALGRLALPLDGVELARRTRKKPWAVARALAWSVERLGRAGRLTGDPERIGDELAKSWRMTKDPGLRGAIWLALEAVRPEAARELVARGFAQREPELRAAALLVARGLPDRGVEAARAKLEDPAACVRAVGLETLERAGTRAAAELLVERLSRETDRRLALRVQGALRRLSGLKHRADPRPWRDWVAGLPADWRPVRRPDPPASEARAGRSRTIDRLPILSDRIAILIDLSGSIWRERDDGRTRKQAIDVELRRTLEELDNSTSFWLIPYASEPLPYGDRLVAASPRNVRAVLSWFEGLRTRGRGNAYDAIQLALGDRDVDTILILSDGAPTGGRRWNLELMVDLLIEQNRFRRVAFDHVLVDASSAVRRHWQRLTEASGGCLIEVAR